jgi:hypothetical protein
MISCAACNEPEPFLWKCAQRRDPVRAGLRKLHVIQPICGTSDAVRRWLHYRSADSVNRKLLGIGEDQVSRLLKAPRPALARRR